MRDLRELNKYREYSHELMIPVTDEERKYSGKFLIKFGPTSPIIKLNGDVKQEDYFTIIV